MNCVKAHSPRKADIQCAREHLDRSVEARPALLVANYRQDILCIDGCVLLRVINGEALALAQLG